MESVIKDEKPPEVVIHHEEKVDFIPSDIGLSDMEVSLVNVMAHEKIMEQALEPFKDKYDYCLIDCMPSLGIITVASLVAADRVLIPVQAQHFALKGLVSLFKSVNQVKRRMWENFAKPVAADLYIGGCPEGQMSMIFVYLMMACTDNSDCCCTGDFSVSCCGS